MSSQQTRRFEESPDSVRSRSRSDNDSSSSGGLFKRSSSSSDRNTNTEEGEHHGKWTSTAQVDEAQLTKNASGSSSRTQQTPSSDWKVNVAPFAGNTHHTDYSRNRDYDYDNSRSTSSSWTSRDRDSRDYSRDYSRDSRDYSRSERDSYYGNGDNYNNSSYSTEWVSAPRPSTYSTYHVPTSSDYSTPSWTSRDTSSSSWLPSSSNTYSSSGYPSTTSYVNQPSSSASTWDAESIWDTTPTFGDSWRQSHPQWQEGHSQWKHQHLPQHVGGHHQFHHPLPFQHPQREYTYDHRNTFLSGLPHANYNPFTQHSQQSSSRQPYGYSSSSSMSSRDGSSRREKQWKADLYSTEHDYIIELNLPGYSRDQIDVKLFGSDIVITAKPPASSDFNFIMRERRFREVTRRVSLPSKVNARGITAVLSNGVLRVTVPHTTI